MDVHMLTLKVMRVSRPTLAASWAPFYSSQPSFSAHSTAAIQSLQGDTPLEGHPTTLRDLTQTGLLTLPSSFGAIQLGETFSSCLCVNNEANQDIYDVRLLVEMQTATSKTVLAEYGGPDDPRTLEVGGTLETIVHSEMKEIGQHVLSCAVSYRTPDSRPGTSENSEDTMQTFRKFYKFAVTNPLSVKTKVHAPRSPSALLSGSEREKVFLEVHIQNLTQEAMCFERMRFECVEGWKVENPDAHASEEQTMFKGSAALMQPQDLRQYIFVLSPSTLSSPVAVPTPGSTVSLGRLDIAWRSNLGEPGRLLTSILARRIPAQPTPAPASALPLYLQRGAAMPTAVPPRPQSPHSRPGTPGPSRTQSPGPIAGPSRLPDLIPDLVVTHIAHDNIHVEKPFDVDFVLTLAESGPSAPGATRMVSLVVQHLQPARPSSTAPQPPFAQSPRAHGPSMSVTAHEPYTPRASGSGSPRSMSMSGFSTPLSPVTNQPDSHPQRSMTSHHAPSQSQRTFNYALAEQKLLVASPRTSGTFDRPHRDDGSREGLLPPPFLAKAVAVKSRSGGVVFSGPSTVVMPPLRLESKSESPRSCTHKFTLSFMPLKRGFMALGGVRLMLVEDRQETEHEEGEGDASSVLTVRKSELRILKEWPVVGEVWVSG